ncbi:hypothetical protein SAMN02745704_00620 [Paucidesulfovibrio gracilis DSM 16080]|uniref:Uncharacterized protein n=1 Tax=Paucidesulfovibrio gracilis DSM 16080 TaxID=1121449 RepID=A0A1T4WAC7_9BACT|nr:hypothetical protein [Paucidesulfovibrio gracilis]SKA74232.1 hypothetical protein SAMN02745704_00620 [Paucidesulfovibrio gracilis DSM 16080]
MSHHQDSGPPSNGEHGPDCGCGCHDHDHGHDHHSHDHDGQDEGHKHYRSQSFEAVLEVVSENETAEAVHGWLNNGDEWFVHGWAEAEGFVFDLTESRRPIERATYYEANQVSEDRVRRYSRVEFFTLMAERGDVGPFDKAFFYTTVTRTDPLEK